jgi:hypothetical protein
MADQRKTTREKLESLISGSWDVSLARYWEVFGGDQYAYMTDEWRKEIHAALNPLLSALLTWAMKVNRIKTGNYEFPHGYEPGGPLRVGFMESAGIDQLNLAVWDGKLFVECTLSPEESIPNQDDGWWRTISEIAEYAPTALEGFCLQSPRTKEETKILKSGRAIAFQITRNFAITQLDTAQRNAQVGTMSSSIPLELERSVVMEKVSTLVRLYAKINQGLHRADYLKYKARERNRPSVQH